MPRKPKEKPKDDDNILVGMEPILAIIESALYTAFVKDSQRVSICLVAPPEAGKTRAMTHFEKFPQVAIYSDLTAKPLNDLRSRIQNDELSHLIITDLVAVSAHNRKTSALLYSRLSAFMEEGMRTVADAGGTVDWKTKDGDAPTVGLIAGMTTELFKDNRSFWNKTGFMSRFVPVCYEHSVNTQVTIRDRMLKYKKPVIPEPQALPKKKVEVKISESHQIEIKRLAQMYATLNKTYGYRFTSHLSGLIRGRALTQGRIETIDDDLEFLLFISNFANPTSPAHI